MEWQTFFYCITSLSVTVGVRVMWARFEPFVWGYPIFGSAVEENNAMQVVMSSLFWGL